MRNFRSRRSVLVGLAVAGAALVPLAQSQLAAASSGVATTDTSPVNISTPISMAAGKAAQRATVTEGDARFEVLAPSLIRLEYSPTASFLNTPTVNVLDRDFRVPAYTETVRHGWLQLTTSALVLRYKLGSGPFNATNTHMRLLHPLRGSASSDPSGNVTPTWEWECTFGQVCQSGAATLGGGASLATNHNNFQSPPGFIAGYSSPGATANWQVLGAPAGTAAVTIRYSNYIGALGGPSPQTMSLVVNGTPTQVTFPATSSWDNWGTVTASVPLTEGTNSVALTCESGDTCNINVDDISVAAPGKTAAPFLPAGSLGGYIRSFDSNNGTYTASPTCTGSESGDTCSALIPSMASGLLDKSGWYLLDDTQSAVWTSNGWIAPRPAGDVEDGYLMAYGADYKTALTDLTALTGPAPLLPEYTFGNWFSRYYPYTTAEYEDQLLPEFQANGVTLDTLSVDTDWKSPNEWDGWEFNPSLFPDPSAFFSWAAENGIHVALNIHSSIATNDPQYASTQALAGNTLTVDQNCNSGTSCAVWDWSNISQAESYFALQTPLEQAGESLTWLDWCCDSSYVSMPGVTPDSWINHLYAQQLINEGQRGFVLARIGASLENSQAGSYPSGPWADHRSAIAFTGDTWGTWNTLAQEAQLAPDEGSIGEPYVSDDIGSFLGDPDGTPNDPDDLYLRWLQMGTFQPIMREHSNAGQNARLPWEYDASTQAVGDQFMQLREELVPYLYTLASQSHSSGLPMTQSLYLDYPTEASAYDFPGEYLLGSNVLVAPVTTPGQVASTQVWFPPGRWVDWFTGATFTGPSTQTLQMPLNRMPVFVKAGGIVPLQPSSDHAANAGSAPLTLQVFSGASGQFKLYDDAGTGLGYEHGQYTQTPISYSQLPGSQGANIVIGPASGSYPGEPASRTYTVDLHDVSLPNRVLLNGRTEPSSDWSYDSSTSTLTVNVGAVSTRHLETVTEVGGAPTTAAEPAATQLTINPSNSLALNPGQSTTLSTTLTNSGPDSITDVTMGLQVPSGWTVSQTSTNMATSVAAGASLTATWSVTAPDTSGLQTADLTATANYTDTATGNPESISTSQTLVPTITSVTPSTASVGDVVTVTGANFGTTQDGGYITFSDDGTNWGAPPDEATFTVDSWSNDQVTFTVPAPSGTNGEWAVVPGSQATVTVTNSQGSTSNTGTVTIGSS